MSTSGSATLAHRSVSNIRSPGAGGPSTPHHQHRTIPANFGSPSSLRADEDVIVIEFGTRKLQVGFAGDSAPRGTIWFNPEQQRRVGDFRPWNADYHPDWRSSSSGEQWGRDYELWRPDIRGQDPGLIGDKIERALREAFTKYLLIDSRPRRMVAVLPSGLSIPLLTAVLDSLFTRLHPPTVALLSSPVATAVAAGLRSAFVVDLGWHETVVTSIYEYREVHSGRSIRGGRMLVEQTHKFLAKHLGHPRPENTDESKNQKQVLSFQECEEVAARMVWCKPYKSSTEDDTTEAKSPTSPLPTVQEHEESESHDTQPAAVHPRTTIIPLSSCTPPTSLELSFDSLAEPCESAFFDSQFSPSCFDDHELPLHYLLYRCFLHLPVDVRAICMSRIIFTGGGTNVLGLRKRIFDEVSHMVQERGWDPVFGKGPELLRANPKLKRKGTRLATKGPTASVGSQQQQSGNENVPSSEQDGVWHDAANVTPEFDPVEEQINKGMNKKPPVQGQMRAIESLGAWSGASLVSHLKVPAIATVEREPWLQHGAAGASKIGETEAPAVTTKSQHRQSLGAGGLMRGSAAGTPWTLGVWGAT